MTLFRQGEDQHRGQHASARGLRAVPYLAHGASAYAIGLKVEDAAATVARARALGAETFEQPVGAGEMRIPAIRGVGGGADLLRR